MMKVQWLGGPADRDWLEVPEGLEALEVYVEGDSGPTRMVPIVEKTFKTDDESEHVKLVLDYYAKA